MVVVAATACTGDGAARGHSLSCKARALQAGERIKQHRLSGPCLLPHQLVLALRVELEG